MSEEKLSPINAWGREYSLFGATADHRTPFYTALAYDFMKAFVDNTPQQSFEAFFICMLAEQDKLYPVTGSNKDKFPPAARKEHQLYLGEMNKKRLPHQERKKELEEEKRQKESELSELTKAKTDKQKREEAKLDPKVLEEQEEQKKAQEKQLEDEISRLKNKIHRVTREIEKLTSRSYPPFYDPGSKHFSPKSHPDYMERMADHVMPTDMELISKKLDKEAVKQRELAKGHVPHFIRNLNDMAQDLGLSDAELKLLILLDVLDQNIGGIGFLKSFLGFACEGNRQITNLVVGRMLGVSPEEMADMIGPESNLRRQGLLEDNWLGELEEAKATAQHLPRMVQMYANILKNPEMTYEVFSKHLHGEEQRTDVKWPKDFDYVDEKFHDTIPNEIIGHRKYKEWYQKASKEEREAKRAKAPEGLSYMFVGPTRSGKSEAAIALACQCKMRPILIGQNMTVYNTDGKVEKIKLTPETRLAQMRAAFEKYKDSTDVILILDEFDSLFPKNIDYHGDDDGKAAARSDSGAERSEFQELIKSSGLPMIFTSNVERKTVHPAVVARMSQVVTVEMPMARSRRRIAMRRLSDQGIAVRDAEGTVLNAEMMANYTFKDEASYQGSITEEQLNELARFQIMAGEVHKAIGKAVDDARGYTFNSDDGKLKVDFGLLEKHFVLIANQNHEAANLSPLEELDETTGVASAEALAEIDFERINLSSSARKLKVGEAIEGYIANEDNLHKGIIIDGPGDDKTNLARYVVTQRGSEALIVRPRNIPAPLNKAQVIDEIVRQAKAQGKTLIFSEESNSTVHPLSVTKQKEGEKPKQQTNGTSNDDASEDKKDDAATIYGQFDEDTLKAVKQKAKEHNVATIMVLDRAMPGGLFDGPTGFFNFQMNSGYLKPEQIEKTLGAKLGFQPDAGIYNHLGGITRRDIDSALLEAQTFNIKDFADNARHRRVLHELLEDRNKGKGRVA